MKYAKTFNSYIKESDEDDIDFLANLGALHGSHMPLDRIDPGSPEYSHTHLIMAADVGGGVRVYAKASLERPQYGPPYIEPIMAVDSMGGQLDWREAAEQAGRGFRARTELENSIFWSWCIEQLIMQNGETSALGFI